VPAAIGWLEREPGNVAEDVRTWRLMTTSTPQTVEQTKRVLDAGGDNSMAGGLGECREVWLRLRECSHRVGDVYLASNDTPGPRQVES
jgi:hypothetical protein